jgi:hypothetical protein
MNVSGLKKLGLSVVQLFVKEIDNYVTASSELAVTFAK